MMWWILGLATVWLLFNWLAPLSVLAFAEPLPLGRIPDDILRKAQAHRVRYYVSDLVQASKEPNMKGLAFSTWLGWKHAVVLDRSFLRGAYPSQIRFVLAHELGHCALGHLKKRWLATVTGLCLLPAVRAHLEHNEEEADAWAEKLSGLSSRVLTDPLKAAHLT